jgi:ADP-L-glycero-D-manno-heptose 6-epimerase
MYAYSKHLFDLHAQRTGMLAHIAGLKYFNVYGPNEAHKGDMRSVVAKAYDQILRDGAVRLFRSERPGIADGEQRRDFLYVKDAVRMTLAVASHPDAFGIFNLGSGRAETWNALARAVFAAMEREPRIEYVDMPAALRGKYQYCTQARTERLRSAGFTERARPIEDGVRDYVRRYLMVDARLDPADPEGVPMQRRAASPRVTEMNAPRSA